MADWDRGFAVNVRGLFQVSRACVPLLAAASHPAIVNLASIAGLRPGPQPFPYAASKAAVADLTKTLAGRLGPQGIRVNAVAPGWMAGEWMEDQLGENYDRLMERRARLTPLRRCVDPGRGCADHPVPRHLQPVRDRRNRRDRWWLHRHDLTGGGAGEHGSGHQGRRSRDGGFPFST